jgi:hypothetical protein
MRWKKRTVDDLKERDGLVGLVLLELLQKERQDTESSLVSKESEKGEIGGERRRSEAQRGRETYLLVDEDLEDLSGGRVGLVDATQSSNHPSRPTAKQHTKGRERKAMSKVSKAGRWQTRCLKIDRVVDLGNVHLGEFLSHNDG